MRQDVRGHYIISWCTSVFVYCGMCEGEEGKQRGKEYQGNYDISCLCINMTFVVYNGEEEKWMGNSRIT